MNGVRNMNMILRIKLATAARKKDIGTSIKSV
jgi:hypothetical protein